MRKWLVILLALFIPSPAFADVLLWTPDGYRAVAANSDHTRYLMLSDRLGEVDGQTVRIGAAFSLMDQEYNSLWDGALGGDGEDTLTRAAMLPDGGWIAVGSSSSGDMGTGWHEGWYSGLEPKTDGWAVRLGADGTVLWSRCYGGGDWDSLHAVCATEDGGAILVGQTYSSDGDVQGWHDSGELFTKADGWVIRVNGQGDILWQRALGGSGEDGLFAACAAEGGYLLAGETSSTDGDAPGKANGQEAWLVFLDTAGNLVWQARYGGEDSGFTAIAAGPEGFVAAGYAWPEDSNLASPSRDGFAVCVDKSGGLLWARTFGYSGEDAVAQVVFTGEYWAFAGETVYGPEETTVWIAGIQPGGAKWAVVRGTM